MCGAFVKVHFSGLTVKSIRLTVTPVLRILEHAGNIKLLDWSSTMGPAMSLQGISDGSWRACLMSHNHKRYFTSV